MTRTRDDDDNAEIDMNMKRQYTDIKTYNGTVLGSFRAHFSKWAERVRGYDVRGAANDLGDSTWAVWVVRRRRSIK